ncbi:MAG: adenosine-specific kinase [Ferroplasma sp.]|uniref:adenosine-specific kinase n=1 Tax=Ferroplasma sp. TaxID=2591003 RepID=UPI002815FA4D|nr:adenosine-specific kinase [Ferroplasma sp.]WMT50406.1 MAG: adenosine-specific kinase [Ferroplasma sp.]
MDISAVEIEKPEGVNVIIGYSHFIKTVEDLNEIIKTVIPGCEYAVVFSEASGDRLIRFEGNSRELIEAGINNIKKISAGHTFIIMLKNAFPISILPQLKMSQEVGTIYAATANPLKVIVAKTENTNAIIGVADGYSPAGVESDDDKKKRRKFLRDIGYKS